MDKYEKQKKHITDILKAFEEYWLANPELRLGQIMSNAFHCGAMHSRQQDLFYMEDTVLLEGLKTLEKG